MEKHSIYESPAAEVVRVEVEQFFAMSEGTTEQPGGEGEGWGGWN